MVNWDPAAQTALSDEEVVYQGVARQALLPALHDRRLGQGGYIVVATTRPETILGDTALCVNPNDPRYGWLPAGARVIVPLVNRSIPVIRDEYVDIEFGTGALKVTPAHDVNDYMLGREIQPRDDRHLQRRRHDQRQSGGCTSAWTASTCAGRSRRDLAAGRPAGEDRGLHQQRGLFRAHGRGHRAEALDAVVPLDGGSSPEPRDEGR